MSGFWANRRASVAAEAEAEKAALEAEMLAEEQAAFEHMDEAEVLEALNLPDPETLTKGDDFSVFMAKVVPDQIRRRALRTLWRSNSVLANVDMLVDYGEDFTDAALAVENIQTAYQVGKGMLKHVEEMARQAAERENPTDASEEGDVEEDADLQVAEDDAPQAAHEALIEDAPAQAVEAVEVAEDDYATPAPRRMKFRIEEHA